ncbi:hypothetical protein TNCV_3691522 [Trichonephila clavipes]|nr:hypothetical protein TNCV_3691522 [Trichonephila clavipes]
MAEEIRTKRAFHEDIFAEDPDKWSWNSGTMSRVTYGRGFFKEDEIIRTENILFFDPKKIASSLKFNQKSYKHATTSGKASGSGMNYDTHTSEVKSDCSSSSSSDENGFVLRGDSNSLKRSFRKRGLSSGSEEINQDDGNSSPGPSSSMSRERLLPSIYDDDAQSGNPSSIYDKKDLVFRSSFNSCNQSRDNSPNTEVRVKNEKLSSVPTEDYLNERNVENKSVSSKGKDCNDIKCKKSVPERRSSRRSKSPERRSRYSRSHSRDKRNSRRSRSLSRGKDRRMRSPRNDRHRSKSRDRRSDRDRTRSSRSRRSRSRDSRRRSRSRSYDRHRSNQYGSSSRDKYHRRHYSRSNSRSRDRSKGSSNRKPGSLPLSTSAGAMTPQMALQQTMAVMNAKAQALTGIALPKYYNPAAVNPLKYAEQVQKRKLLWQPKEKIEEQPKNTVWDKLTFAQDQDGKMTAKFRKLMGIKSEANSEETEDTVLKRQEVLFQDLDKQYEMARMTTHTQRGVGLGYSAQPLYPPVQK